MRVCIPIPFRPEGGGFYFLDSFRRHLSRCGWPVLESIDDDYDVLFTNHWMVPRHDILRAVRRNPRVCIVQRIDGAAADYGRKDNSDRSQSAVNRIADLTIFQSRYCRHSTREKFSVIGQDGPVIHNPVDVELFRPDGPRRDLLGAIRVACVTWSTNPLKGAADIYEVAGANPDVNFHLCGRYPDAPTLANVHTHGILGRADLAAVLRSCDVLLTFSRNEACPNHVLEGLASGLAVLYHDSGASGELVRDCGAAVSVSTFRSRLDEVLMRRDELAAAARACALAHHHPDRIFSAYLEKIAAVASRRPRPARYIMALGEIPLAGALANAADLTRRVRQRLIRMRGTIA